MDAAPGRQRPLREAVALIDPMAALDQTHKDVLVQLRRLQELLDRIDAQGSSDDTRALATEICEFFSGTARRHHADEETQVFPLLLERGNEEMVQNVRRLQQHHGWLEEDWLELGPQLAMLCAGYSGHDIDLIRQGVAVFNALYLEHISLEEGVVYPAARDILRARMPSAA